MTMESFGREARRTFERSAQQSALGAVLSQPGVDDALRRAYAPRRGRPLIDGAMRTLEMMRRHEFAGTLLRSSRYEMLKSAELTFGKDVPDEDKRVLSTSFRNFRDQCLVQMAKALGIPASVQGGVLNTCFGETATATPQ